MAVYSAVTDNNLLTLLKKDDKHAFTELYNRYWDKLFIIASHTLNSSEEAEEVVHDVFLNLWKLRHDLEITKSLNNYLAVAVKYQVLNKLKLQARRQQLLSKRILSPDSLYNEDPTGNWLREKELMRELEKTVQQLPEKCGIVFRLSRENGQTSKQIAEQLNISVNTVDSHLAKALRILRHRFQKLVCFIWII